MQKIKSSTDLRAAILQLECQQAEDGIILKEHFREALNSIKPINLMKSAFAEATESGELKDKMVNTGVGLTAGFLSKLLFQGATKSPVKRLIGTAIMFGITNLVAKNPEAIKSFGQGVLKIFKPKPAK